MNLVSAYRRIDTLLGTCMSSALIRPLPNTQKIKKLGSEREVPVTFPRLHNYQSGSLVYLTPKAKLQILAFFLIPNIPKSCLSLHRHPEIQSCKGLRHFPQDVYFHPGLLENNTSCCSQAQSHQASLKFQNPSFRTRDANPHPHFTPKA